jgi:hypothetical protein
MLNIHTNRREVIRLEITYLRVWYDKNDKSLCVQYGDENEMNHTDVIPQFEVAESSETKTIEIIG